ncbi:hypothetical protein TNCV_3110751 [Trichonephila clavipes]|nr:hypothetical protein TNCV_3110751 [Trichonephila clavipes]
MLNLASCDFWMFSKKKMPWKGSNFLSGDEVRDGGVEHHSKRNLPVGYSDQDIRLSKSDCEESEESADEIDNIPVNHNEYVADMAQNA